MEDGSLIIAISMEAIEAKVKGKHFRESESDFFQFQIILTFRTGIRDGKKCLIYSQI
jgi:hypothetical protein